MCRQVPHHLSKSRAPSWIMLTWGDNHHHCKCATLPSSHRLVWIIPMVSCGQLSCLCPLPASCGGVGWEAERGSVLCTAHTAMTKTSLYRHCRLQHKNPQNTVAMRKLTPPNAKQAHGAGVQNAFRPFQCCIRVAAVQTKAEPSPNSCPRMKLQNEEDLTVS